MHRMGFGPIKSAVSSPHFPLPLYCLHCALHMPLEGFIKTPQRLLVGMALHRKELLRLTHTTFKFPQEKRIIGRGPLEPIHSLYFEFSLQSSKNGILRGQLIAQVLGLPFSPFLRLFSQSLCLHVCCERSLTLSQLLPQRLIFLLHNR